MRRPTCWPFRWPISPIRCRPVRRCCWGTSCSPSRRCGARPRRRANCCPTTCGISSCTVSCTCSASIMTANPRPPLWKPVRSRSWAPWGCRIPTATLFEQRAGPFQPMSDTEPPPRDGEPEQPGSLSRLRTLLRLIRRPREPRDTVDALVAAAELEGAPSISSQERVLIGNILKGHDRTAADVMVPRVDIVALDVDQPFTEVIKCMVEHGHSRVPVYRETLDDVIGFVHVKDVLAPVADRRPVKLTRLLRKVLFVAPSVPILDLLVQMRQARTHMAMVVDEFGGIDGLATIEDVIEEIVGEIEDEHDVPDAPSLIERPDGSVIADARLPIETLEEQHGTRLRPDGDEEAVDTLGGLVFTLAGRVPKRGEVIAHPDGIEFEVLDADPRRVKRLRVRGLPAAIGKGVAGA